ncbi:hypothetical protein CHS0354_004634 [Potamilus streckersoni]|uniref:Uncharacterized protein n=1 Tax=Potamilus streckersoni TaxID=2493646 RepID=A0AAE0VPN6_9BIVA|nr:hypothetical protein CHS0354_004634 [Potamilus streckersoni]
MKFHAPTATPLRQIAPIGYEAQSDISLIIIKMSSPKRADKANVSSEISYGIEMRINNHKRMIQVRATRRGEDIEEECTTDRLRSVDLSPTEAMEQLTERVRLELFPVRPIEESQSVEICK